MVAYFDLENLISFLNQPKDELFDDCMRVIKKQLDLTFNFKKEELINFEEGLIFLKKLTEGVENEKKIKFIEEKFPARSLKSNTHNHFNTEQLLSVYFINDSNLNSLMNREELLIADVGDEIKMFKTLLLNNNDYKFDKKLRIGSEFSSWKILQEYKSPFIDLIIVDNFILSDKSLFETNLKGIIENTLVSESRKKINILIFLKSNQNNIPFEELKTKIKSIVVNKCKEVPNITLIKHYSEHDRTILLNFIRIYSGDSFNYFLSNGQTTTKGKEIHFVSIVEKENYKLYIEMLKDLQKIINNSKQDSIIGDKKSRLLKFN
jgi:hypothetical protein